MVTKLYCLKSIKFHLLKKTIRIDHDFENTLKFFYL